MKKTIIALALVGSSIGVAQADTFVGGSYGLNWSGLERNGAAHENLSDQEFNNVFNRENTWGLRIGKRYETYRVYGVYDYSTGNSKGNKLNQQNLIGSVDYLYPINDKGTTLFGGGSAGVNRLSNRTANYANDDSYAFAYGFQAGVLQEIDKNFELEGGYRYLRTENSIDYRENGVKQGTADLKYTQQAYVAVNYHF